MEIEEVKKSKNINTQKLLVDLYKNFTDGNINQETYEIEREKIISGKSLEKSLKDSASDIIGESKHSDKSFIGKTDELLNLKKLLDEKVISQEEFEKAKEEVLNFNNQKFYDEINETTSALIESELSLFWGFFVSSVIIVISLLFYFFYI